MYKGKKVINVMPAYNAAATLEKTYKEIPSGHCGRSGPL